MKTLKVLFKLFVIFAIVYLISGFMARSSYKVERSTTVNAPQDIVYNQLVILKNWENWSPWKEKDPTVVNTYDGADGAEGSKLKWVGDEDISGSGSIEILQAYPPSSMNYKLNFEGTPQMGSQGYFQLQPVASDKTTVIWTDAGDIPFVFRPIMMFMDMEDMIGPDFERGLFKLDSLCSLHYSEALNEVIRDTTAM